MARARSLGDLLVAALRFIWVNRWWWIVPILLVILVFFLLVMTSEVTGPFMYTAPDDRGPG